MFLRCIILLSMPALISACSGPYHYLTVKEVQYGDLFNLTAHVIDNEGFVLNEVNPSKGFIDTYWDYKKLVDVGRFPIRRKVECQIDPKGEGEYEIRLIIDQEALWQSYMVNDPQKAKNWEEYGTDKETAMTIISRIKLLTREFEASDEFYDRWRRKEQLREGVPDVLKSPEEK